ncbi:hypothetical protein [Oleiharenicola lentus]|uniref:hypothetical protein n=1 Tax=Oleiharenicola lentus TaxID=2508720 RepID=UPI003F6769DD
MNENNKMTPEELEKFIHRELRALPPRKAPAGFEARLQAAVEARTAAVTASVGQAESMQQLVHRELRALPLRKAPRSLESRVMAAIEAQASVAWYHKSWNHWPVAVRGVFLAFATSVAAAVIFGGYRAFAGAEQTASAVGAEVGQRVAVFTKFYHAVMWVVDLGQSVVHSLPPLWLYGGLAFAVFTYAAFFGLGAAAYRTLYRSAD